MSALWYLKFNRKENTSYICYHYQLDSSVQNWLATNEKSLVLLLVCEYDFKAINCVTIKLEQSTESHSLDANIS